MNKYTKAITAIFTAVLTGLAAFGIIVPDDIQAMVTSLIPAVGAVLVYALPNGE